MTTPVFDIIVDSMWQSTRGLVRDLEARLDKMEKVLKAMDTEWTDTYEKFRNLHRRIAKREKAAAREDWGENATAPVEQPSRNPLAFRMSRMRGGDGGVLPTG